MIIANKYDNGINFGAIPNIFRKIYLKYIVTE